MAVKFNRSLAPTAADSRFSSTGVGMGCGGEGGEGGGEGGGRTYEVSSTSPVSNLTLLFSMTLFQNLMMQPCCSHHFRRLEAARAMRFLFMSCRSSSVTHARCFALRILSNLGNTKESLKGQRLPRARVQSFGSVSMVNVHAGPPESRSHAAINAARAVALVVVCRSCVSHCRGGPSAP